jgi:hypothetical protein
MGRQERVIGGLARTFFQRVGRHYDKPIAWLFEPRSPSPPSTLCSRKLASRSASSSRWYPSRKTQLHRPYQDRP